MHVVQIILGQFAAKEVFPKLAGVDREITLSCGGDDNYNQRKPAKEDLSPTFNMTPSITWNYAIQTYWLRSI